MIYNQFQGVRLSALGMGTMHLPTIDGKGADIDREATAEMIAYAMEHGINYYDTAWGYHEGYSEPVIGEILSQYLREKFYIAMKFPGYDLSNMDEVFDKVQKWLAERSKRRAKVRTKTRLPVKSSVVIAASSMATRSGVCAVQANATMFGTAITSMTAMNHATLQGSGKLT